MGDVTEKDCPFCGEKIKQVAIKCRFCGEFLDQSSKTDSSPLPKTGPQSSSPGDQGQEDESEEFIFSGPLSKFAVVGPFLVLLIGLAVAACTAIFGSYAVSNAGSGMSQYKNLPVFAGLGIALIVSLWFGTRWIVFRSRVFRISRERIEFEEGIFSRRVENMDMWRVEDIRFHQSIAQRIFGVGSIYIESSDTNDPTMTIGPIPDARKLFDAMQKIQRKADRRQGVVHFEK